MPAEPCTAESKESPSRRNRVVTMRADCGPAILSISDPLSCAPIQSCWCSVQTTRAGKDGDRSHGYWLKSRHPARRLAVWMEAELNPYGHCGRAESAVVVHVHE